MVVAIETRQFERIAPDRYRHHSNDVTYEWQACGLLSASHTPQIWPTRSLANAARIIDRIEGVERPHGLRLALLPLAALLPVLTRGRRWGM